MFTGFHTGFLARRGKRLIEGGLGFGFFVCFKPYILLVYSFIDEIVDIFKEKSHTFLL